MNMWTVPEIFRGMSHPFLYRDGLHMYRLPLCTYRTVHKYRMYGRWYNTYVRIIRTKHFTSMCNITTFFFIKGSSLECLNLYTIHQAASSFPCLGFRPSELEFLKYTTWRPNLEACPNAKGHNCLVPQLNPHPHTPLDLRSHVGSGPHITGFFLPQITL